MIKLPDSYPPLPSKSDPVALPGSSLLLSFPHYTVFLSLISSRPFLVHHYIQYPLNYFSVPSSNIFLLGSIPNQRGSRVPYLTGCGRSIMHIVVYDAFSAGTSACAVPGTALFVENLHTVKPAIRMSISNLINEDF